MQRCHPAAKHEIRGASKVLGPGPPRTCALAMHCLKEISGRSLAHPWPRPDGIGLLETHLSRLKRGLDWHPSSPYFEVHNCIQRGNDTSASCGPETLPTLSHKTQQRTATCAFGRAPGCTSAFSTRRHGPRPQLPLGTTVEHRDHSAQIRPYVPTNTVAHSHQESQIC